MKNPPNILVVDDNAALADNVVEYLNLQGYKARAAYGGKEGLAAFDQGKFKVVLVDLVMPDMGGLALLQAVRKRDPDAVVIILTGYGTVKAAVTAVKAGAFDYITKPFRLSDIAGTVQRALEDVPVSRPVPAFVSLLLADLVLLASAFCLVHYLRYGHLCISGNGYLLLTFQAMILLAVSLFTDKFSLILKQSLVAGAGLLLKSGIAFLFVLSLLLVGFHLTHFSRIMAYVTIVVFVILEVEFFALYQWVRGEGIGLDKSPVKPSRASISGTLAVLDGVLLVLSFFAVTYLKRGSVRLNDPYDDILLLLLGLWLASSLFTRKFNRDNFTDISLAMGPAIKSALFTAAGLTLFIYGLRLGPISRFQALGAIPLFFVLESLVFLFYSNYRRHGRLEPDIEDAGKIQNLVERKESGFLPETVPECLVADPVEPKLRNALEFFEPAIFDFISAHVDLKQVDRCNCALLNTDEIQDLNFLGEGEASLIVNLHKLNDIRWFNRYFLLCHEKLKPGGYLVCKAHTTATQYDYYLSKYPGLTGRVIYGVKFVWDRVFPKLPWFKKLYFSITKGRNRAVSRAELLGRLSFCGFEITAEREIGRRLYVIARKVAAPSWNQNPSYGPIVTLTRIGTNGKLIPIYKFRTMHPYSEFIQDYVYRNQGLQRGGKLENDFRVTGWGKVMRRLWIDELPMLYNWVRGDLQLFGVRPLSLHYLSLYPPDVQALRMLVKPGLVPPFYADMPETFDEICESEKRYIEAYLRHPLRIQWWYFWRAFFNIVFRGARSH